MHLRSPAAGSRRLPIGLDWLAIVALPLLLQAPGLLHWIDSDPLLLISPLRTGGQAGWLPGFPGWIDPNIGATTQSLGHLAASAWLAGRLPWWNPYSGVGVPLAAEMQPAALFLPFVLLLHLHDGLLWLRVAMGAIGGLGAYELARALGMRRTACLVAGVLFACNGTAAWLPHGPERAAAFLPWILLGVERARSRAVAGRPLGWLWTAAGLAWSIYAGFPEVAYLDGLLVTVWTLWRVAAPFGAQLPPPGVRAWTVRRRLLGKMAASLAVALLLAAPAIVPFAHYLRHADLGLHGAGFAHARLPANAFPMFLLPYLYGPIEGFGAANPEAPTAGVWGLIGGYAGAAACVLAVLRLLGGGPRSGGLRDGGLRWVLAFWIALCLARTAALPGVTAAMNQLPLMRSLAFMRYAEPSWELAVILLAAAAIEDWRHAALARWRALLGAALCLALVAGALALAWPTLRALTALPGYTPFPIFAVEWAILLAVLLPLLLAAGPQAGWRRAAVLALVGVDAVAMFALPLASATRGASIDRAPLDFLRAHLGLQRFYSMAAIPPNYGALFGLAQIDDDMVPVPLLWADQIRTTLDPLAVPVTFTGSNGGRPPGPNARGMLFRHLDAYRALGVRYVVTQRGIDSLDSGIASVGIDRQGVALGLPPGAATSGVLPPGFAEGRGIDDLRVRIGTYDGRADGVLAVQLCTPSGCAHGRAALRGAADNAELDIRLDATLPTGPDDALRFTLTHRGGTAPVAIWLVPGSAASSLPATVAGAGPAIVLRGTGAIRRVFRDAHVDIFELPDPSPYVSADPSCSLAVAGRQDLVATCPAPATLLRRELAFPGWSVRLDGRRAELGSAGIFQTVALPAGRTRVRFRYAPPFIRVARAAASLGLAWVLLAALGATAPGRAMAAGAWDGTAAAAQALGRGVRSARAAGRGWTWPGPRPRWLPGRPATDRLLIVLLPLLVWLPGLLGLIDSSPMLVLTALGYGGHPGLQGGLPGWLDVNFGFTTEALGRLAANSWIAGHVPWWNPYSGVGVPLAAEMQPAALFLPFILLLHFDHGLILLRWAMQIVAGLATYELLLALGLRRSACLIGGVLFAFNGTAAWMAHGPDRAAAFLPLILLGIERAGQCAGQRRPLGWLWLAVGLAYSLYAGFPETAFLDGLFAAAWAACRLVWPADPPATGRRGSRARLLAKLAAGGATGLLLAAPAVWPFLQYLRLADIGDHAGMFAHASLPSNGYPLFLIPFLFGNIASFGGTGPADATWITWGEIGGYVGLAATVLAGVGLLAGRSGLRWLPAVWIVACLAKTANLPIATPLFNAVPMIQQTAFFRYAEPSWELATIVLAAFGVDAWLRGRLRRGTAMAAVTAAALLLAGASVLAWPTILRLLPMHHYVIRLVPALLWSLSIAASVSVLVFLQPIPRRVAALVAIVCLDAMVLFAVPLSQSTRGARLDLRPIEFLRAHLGLQRFYALGAIVPNYSAYFGLASIDETMIPVPRNWAEYIRSALDPFAEPVAFDGLSREGRPESEQPRAALKARLDAYRALGVRYLLASSSQDPLEDSVSSEAGGQGRTALPLPAGEAVQGTLPANLAASGRAIARIGVMIGTYGGAADGALALQLCTPRRCEAGAAALAGAGDNEDFTVTLRSPLPIAAGDALRFSIRHDRGSHPVAVWLSPDAQAQMDHPLPEPAGPRLTLVYETAEAAAPVFRDARITIFELSNAAPYFSTTPACALAPAGRLEVAATCAAPAVLTRRELSFPGWRARIDGHAARLGSSGLFQTVALPAGRSRVAFRYAPPAIGLAHAAAALGVLWMLLAAAASRLRAPLWRRSRRAA